MGGSQRSRPKAQNQEAERKPARLAGAKATLAVLVILVAGVMLAVEALWTGSLFVLVESSHANQPSPAPLVCVYEGHVAAALKSGDAERIPQAVAAVSVPLGQEVEIFGHWKGNYTLAVVSRAGTVDNRACIVETAVGKDATHVAFMMAQTELPASAGEQGAVAAEERRASATRPG